MLDRPNWIIDWDARIDGFDVILHCTKCKDTVVFSDPLTPLEVEAAAIKYQEGHKCE